MILRLTRRGLLVAGRTLPCSIGRTGISASKREGDGATPKGRHAVVACFYRADRTRRPNGFARAIGPSDLWSDDPSDPRYNHLVRAPSRFGHERLRRADPMYDVVLVLDWNWPDAVPGMGSAIFIHQWRRPRYPTAGCIALARRDLLWLARRVRRGTLVQV